VPELQIEEHHANEAFVGTVHIGWSNVQNQVGDLSWPGTGKVGLDLDVLDQMRRGVRHPSRRTRWTQAAAFAAKRDDDLVLARRAAHPREAASQIVTLDTHPI
jgi:hypothetical protein